MTGEDRFLVKRRIHKRPTELNFKKFLILFYRRYAILYLSRWHFSAGAY